MPLCFFVSPFDGDVAALPDDKAHHVRSVLRMHAGESLTLHDGANRAADAKIVVIDKKAVTVALTSAWRTLSTELPRPVLVVQALPKIGEKAEHILQHGTELGATGFVFFASERATRLEGIERIARKLARWEEIARNAAEQSGRGIVPSVAWADTLPDAVALLGDAMPLVLDLDGATALHAAPLGAENATLALFVGPEGGFTKGDHAQLEGTRVSLGPRVLRTETAALAALAQLGARLEG